MVRKLVRFCFYLASAATVFFVFNTEYNQKIVLPSSSTNLFVNQNLRDHQDITWQTSSSLSPRSVDIKQRRFAVLSCATPNKNSHRGFDYAFYLPLTVLAWKRIGFESIVLIVGDKGEWMNNPILSYVLENLESLSPDVTILFMSSKVANRIMLSQTARIFVANMEGFPGRPSDFLMTTDSDLWPLRKEHYYLPKGINTRLMLLHSDCCRPFRFGGRSYKMQPMSNIGASAATWKEIFNSQSTIVAKDSESILDYFQETFGEKVRYRVLFASGQWFLDQKMVTLRIEEWFNRQNSSKNDIVYQVSDTGFDRLHRIAWNTDEITPEMFDQFYDAHLPVDGFKSAKWETIQPLLHLMYDKESDQYEFCDHYAMGFKELFIMFQNGN
jgi:hypothetical protein